VDDFRLRRGLPADAPELSRTMQLGFETYRAFAPADWSPPPEEVEHLRERLADPRVWCLVAEREGEMAGHVAFMPASEHRVPEPDPRVAQLWQLFVREAHWGSPLATTLHAEAVREAAARGFASFRLFTPAAQARACRFYEREGWTACGPTEDDMGFGMPLVTYRRSLPEP
jgi:GNAT superfamily N-acetyltransferase